MKSKNNFNKIKVENGVDDFIKGLNFEEKMSMSKESIGERSIGSHPGTGSNLDQLGLKEFKAQDSLEDTTIGTKEKS